MEKTVAVLEKSDQGQACVNTVEGVYLVSVLFAIFIGIGTVLYYITRYDHVIWSILYGPYDMDRMIWTV